MGSLSKECKKHHLVLSRLAYAREGILLRFMPKKYEATYAAFYHANQFSMDSITRDTMKRNLTPIFPLLNVETGLGYHILPGWQTD